MNILQLTRAIIEADTKASQCDWTARGSFVDLGYATIGGVYRGGDEDTLTPEDAKFIAISRQSPEVSRALIRAVELLQQIYHEADAGHRANHTIHAFLAEINKETT